MVLPISSLDGFGSGGIAKLLVGQGVDVSSQTGRGGRVDAGDMVIDTILMDAQVSDGCRVAYG